MLGVRRVEEPSELGDGNALWSQTPYTTDVSKGAVRTPISDSSTAPITTPSVG